MGSEGPPAVTIHMTGFKKFHGVPENPTETIVSNIREYMNKRGLPKGLTLGSCSILETAGHGAVASLYKTLQLAIEENDSELTNSRRVIWVSCFIREIPSLVNFTLVFPNYLSMTPFYNTSHPRVILFWVPLVESSELKWLCVANIHSLISIFRYILGSIVVPQNLLLSIKLLMKLLFAVRMRWDGSLRCILITLSCFCTYVLFDQFILHKLYCLFNAFDSLKFAESPHHPFRWCDFSNTWGRANFLFFYFFCSFFLMFMLDWH